MKMGSFGDRESRGGEKSPKPTGRKKDMWKVTGGGSSQSCKKSIREGG